MTPREIAVLYVSHSSNQDQLAEMIENAIREAEASALERAAKVAERYEDWESNAATLIAAAIRDSGSV
jgi:hypothetical protein